MICPLSHFLVKMMMWMILLVFLVPCSCTSLPASVDDKQSLLDFKKSISSDPLKVLDNWIPTMNLCNWTGVTCDSALADERVSSLVLASMKLEGSISPSIGNLSFLTILDLFNNSFGGRIPPEIGRLQVLEKLYLSDNALEGSIPKNLSGCKQLKGLFLASNQLTGPIPAELSQLTNLQALKFGVNSLTGNIPPTLANLSYLEILFIGDNDLEGHIPPGLGMLSRLGSFLLFGNPRLTGPIPSSLSNISGLVELALYSNNLTGTIPPELGKLSHLRFLLLWHNKLSGTIPATLANCSDLGVLDLQRNRLNGAVPLELSRLWNLQVLSLSSNQLVSGSDYTIPILAAMSNCTLLRRISFYDNRLTGSLPHHLPTNLSVFLLWGNNISGNIPSEIANLSNLTYLDLSFNHLTGHIPSSLRRLEKLERLLVDNNKLEGNLPTEIGEIKNLGLLSARHNMLSGQVPHTIADLQQLRQLLLNNNQLSGNIPASLGECYELELLDLSNNNFRGSLPQEVVSLPNLQFYFNLSGNLLQGSIPAGIGKMIHVQAIDISFNRLEGRIPATLGSCEELQYLMLSSNRLQSTIPRTLSNLKSLVGMDLSSNNLSGPIPPSLGSLNMLQYLNLSFNNLSGEIPEGGVFKNLTAPSFIGNALLCRESKNFLSCRLHTGTPGNDHNNKILILVSVAGVVAFLLCFSIIVGVIYRKRKISSQVLAPDAVDDRGISYEEIRKATEEFSQANLLGTGSFGSVYRGILRGGRVAAFKLLNPQSSEARKSFTRECKVLREVRHRNLVKIITFCFEFGHRVLVLEFMSKGNLEKLMKHYSEGNISLSFREILSIAIDVIHGLEYLHHDCFVQVVHSDIKPSNILLDEDMTAHVADFGISKIFRGSDYMESAASTSTVALKGSIGYIAPEYAFGGNVSVKGDVYSYGIMLLEMITGKSPTDDMFGGELNLYKWVKMFFPERLEEIVDMGALGNTAEFELNEGVVAFTGLALECSKQSPHERPTAREVARALEAVKVQFSFPTET